MKRITHVIFIANQPLTVKFRNDFYFERLTNEGYKIEYWNLAALFNKIFQVHRQIFNEQIINIENYKQLEEKIERYKLNSLFIFSISYSARAYKLFRLFSKYNCLTAIFARGALPHPTANYSLIKRFFLKFKALGNLKYFKEVVRNQSSIVAKRFKLIKPYNFIFYAGTSGISNIGYGYKYGLEKSKLIPINSFDYDNYILLKEKNCRQVHEPYCVFLDAYLPFHPDFEMLGLPKVDAVNYFKSLNSFFDKIENAYKIKVVMAAHPKSDYETKRWYGERIVIKNKTAELVKYADFVLAHLSTSISFAILFKKPLVFIYNNAIKETYPYTQYPIVIYFSKLLKAACINADADSIKNLDSLSVDEPKYQQYKYNFLTNPESEFELSEEIVIDALKNSLSGT